MAVTNEELQAAILQLLQRLAVPQATNPEQVLESLSTNSSEFCFDPENGTTFEKWFALYSDLFESDARSLDDAAKVRLLLRKLETSSYSRYVNYILPKLPKDVTFADTVKTLTTIFGRQTSVFHKRYQCMQLLKSEADDIITYGGNVNRACAEFEFQNLKIDHFKCLIFVCGLKAPRYADILARLLSRIEGETADAPVTIQTLIDELQRLVNIKSDTTMIEHPSSSKNSVHSISEKKPGNQHRPLKTESMSTPRTPCWQCGQMHYVRDCPSLQVFCSKRPVPFNTIPLVDAELTRLQSLGIITPFDFSEWAAPIVAVRKPNGKVRICADYSTGLNEALEANHYPLPTPEEIFAQLNESTIFSIIDLSDAYLQVEVDEESKKFLTINTHRGLFQFNRLAPGLKSAPGTFQRLVDSMIADIPGVRSFLDNAIIFGRTWEEHKASLDKLLQRLGENGFHVKQEKFHFFHTEIRYLGHIVDRNGIRPDPENLQAIASIPAPTRSAIVPGSR
ncbi:uncharacterized protein K02A2.6-like [Ochlerotatus camptorhynchus]|uniref:uncharacterized protein K02A2.6-like n=1 Tax=Ochlerotatus camptorhynchus TaxID=644619 RepID=UPI0031E43C75